MDDNFIDKVDENTQIGLVRHKCADAEIHEIGEVASCYHHIKQQQTNNGTWCYENYTELGSDSFGPITNSRTGRTKDCIIWPINHYLGLNRHPYVIQKAKEALDAYGAGCGTSAMSGGHNALHKKLESRLAGIFDKEDALLFTTGYSANVGALSGLAKRGNNLILIDREAHASLVDGCKLAKAKYLPFKHNSIEDLENKLEKYSEKYSNIFVVVESVYSMTGDIAPLEHMIKLKEMFDFRLFVDEAHAFGLYGKKKAGLCQHLNISKDVDFIMTTLSKATGSIGGVVATTKEFVTLLQVEANAYLFQAALPPPDTAAVYAALDCMQKYPEIIDSVWEKTVYLRKNLKDMGFDIGEGESPIVPVYIRDSEILMKMGKDLFEGGIFTTSVAYPVVHHNEVRFRLIVNESHTYEHIDYTLQKLEELGKKYNLLS